MSRRKPASPRPLAALEAQDGEVRPPPPGCARAAPARPPRAPAAAALDGAPRRPDSPRHGEQHRADRDRFIGRFRRLARGGSPRPSAPAPGAASRAPPRTRPRACVSLRAFRASQPALDVAPLLAQRGQRADRRRPRPCRRRRRPAPRNTVARRARPPAPSVEDRVLGEQPALLLVEALAPRAARTRTPPARETRWSLSASAPSVGEGLHEVLGNAVWLRSMRALGGGHDRAALAR